MSKKLACWSQMACRKMDCNSFPVAQSADRQRCVAALIQTWLVSIPPAASMKRSCSPVSPAHPQDTSNRSSWVLIQPIALWRVATASSAAVGMMWRTVKRVIPNSLGATQCMCLCVCVSMCGHPHTFQPEQKHWGLRCSAIPSASPSSAEEIQELSQDVAAPQPKNGLCVCRGFCPAPEHPCRCHAAAAEIIRTGERQSETKSSFMIGENFLRCLGWRVKQEGVQLFWIPARSDASAGTKWGVALLWNFPNFTKA